MEDELDKRLKGACERTLRFKEIAASLKQMRFDKEKLEQQILKYKSELAGASLELYKLESKTVSIFDSAKETDKRLTMERNNTAVARLRCSRAEKELRELAQSIEDLNAESGRLAGSGEEYESLYEQKKQKLIAEGGDRAQLIIDLVNGITTAKARLKEISDACKTCDKALLYLDGSHQKLEKAQKWGRLDMMGGKYLASTVKHDHIKSAIIDANNAKAMLEGIGSKAAGIDSRVDINIKSTGAGRIADVYMDNIGTDMMVQGRINRSTGNVADAKFKLRNILCNLTVLERQAKNGLNNMQTKLDSIILA